MLKRALLTFFVVLIVYACSSVPVEPVVKSVQTGSITFNFADKVEGSELISQSDVYISSLTMNQIRNYGYDRNFSNKDEYLGFLADQVLDWNNTELERLESVLNELEKTFVPVEHLLPESIYIVKTNGKDQNDHPYTRNTDTIILPRNFLRSNAILLKTIIIHEVFHLLSKSNPEIVYDLYKLVGYTYLEYPLSIPEEISDRFLVNPDAPYINSAIDVQLDGNAITVSPVLFYDATYFFELQYVKLVEKNGRFEATDQIYSGYDFDNYSDFLKFNTKYIIHPEEMLADNFVHWLYPDNISASLASNTSVVESIKDALSK